MLESGQQAKTIFLEGVADISSAAALKGQLLERLEAGSEVRVSVAAVSSMDITTMQLLWAAARQAVASGVRFHIAGDEPNRMPALFREAGIENFPQAGE